MKEDKMANEIDLYKDLKHAEGFYAYCVKNKFTESAKRAKKVVEKITKEIKENYPDLKWGK